MSSQRFHGALITLCLLLGCRLSVAMDAGSSPDATSPALVEAASPAGGPANPASVAPADMGGPATPAMMAVPADVGAPASDASTHRKFYILSASLREIYDSNVNTSNVNPQASLETVLSPSILVDFPMQDSDFSARYTFDIT
jgi:hypothetical protein